VFSAHVIIKCFVHVLWNACVRHSKAAERQGRLLRCVADPRRASNEDGPPASVVRELVGERAGE